MKKLILFELRKIFSKRLSLIVLVGILLFSVLISFSTYQNKFAFDGVSAEGAHTLARGRVIDIGVVVVGDDGALGILTQNLNMGQP